MPQGSVLSPYLYAVYINGLHEALRRAGLGVRLYGRLVSLLLYADDVVLLARSPAELQKMLFVLDAYAAKWRFSLNQKKSKVVVVAKPSAKRDAKKYKWTLNGNKLDVVIEYKYLGVEMGKTVGSGRWNALLERLYRKAKSALALLLFRAGGSDGLSPTMIQRMWMAECRPLLEYGSELWGGMVSKDWERKLESLQYQFGKAALGLHGMPAAIGVRMELALPSMQSRRRQLKLGYWDKLCNADSSRLLSLIFRRRHAEVCAGGGQYSQLRAFQHTLRECSLGNSWLGRCSGSKATMWAKVSKQAASQVSWREEDVEMQSKSSLQLYATLGLRPAQIPQYVDDRSNIEGTRLLSKCRLGYLRLLDSVARDMAWPSLRARCLLCRSGTEENVQHFLSCPGLVSCQRAFDQVCRDKLSCLGVPGLFLLSGVLGRQRLQLLLAGSPSWPECPADQDQDAYRDLCGQAAWSLDKAVKNFLVACWRLRESVVGVLLVKRGVFCRTASTFTARDLLRKRIVSPTSPPSVAKFHNFWQKWVPVIKKDWHGSGRRKPANFYVVFHGRQTGVFYKWSDCVRSIASVEGSKVKGFDTLQLAEQTYSSSGIESDRSLCHPTTCRDILFLGIESDRSLSEERVSRGDEQELA